MNWRRGSQFTARHTKNRLQFDEKSHNSGMKNRNFTKKYTDRKTIISNNYAKLEVNWSRGNLQRDIQIIAYNLMNKVP